MVRFIFTFATVLLVAGCASAPGPPTQDISADLPAQWSKAPDASGKAPTFWWQNFQDEALSEAIGQAHVTIAGAYMGDPGLGLLLGAQLQTSAVFRG